MKEASSKAQERLRIWLMAGVCAALSACGAQPPELIDSSVVSVEEVEKLEQVVDTSLPLVQQAYSIQSEKVCENSSQGFPSCSRGSTFWVSVVHFFSVAH